VGLNEAIRRDRHTLGWWLAAAALVAVGTLALLSVDF